MKKINRFKGLIFKGFITCVIIASFIIVSVPAFAAPVSQTPPKVTVAAGQTWVVPVGTTKLTDLTIEPGEPGEPAGVIKAPDGYSVTMTVNGVETGQKLVPIDDPETHPDTFGVDTYFVPGTYHGNIVLTVAETNYQTFGLTFPVRQGLYLDSTGVVNDESVLAAVVGKKPSGNTINNIQINSTGEDFNGIWSASGDHTINNAKIDFNGNGRSDFAGYGAAVAANGTALTLTDGGSGYSSAPTVAITGDGTGATATATITGGSIESVINVTAGGSNYDSNTDVTIGSIGGGPGGPGGSGAVLTPTIVGGVITGIAVTSGGSGYTYSGGSTSLPVNISDPGGQGSGAEATAIIDFSSSKVSGLTLTSGGYGYTHADVSFEGGGGTGAAATATVSGGSVNGTTLVLDGANIHTRGVVRTGVIATGNSHVIVKNSTISTMDGVLPAGYIDTVDQSQMMSVPWMLSLSGNCRATNLMGDASEASYINSSISAEGWGVLSSDSGTNCTLNAINDTITTTGTNGYGSYAIGNVTENFLGCTFNVGSYATINRGGACHYGNSTPAAVAALNTTSSIGLTPKELAKLPNRPTIINSNRFGFMWHGSGSALIDGGTIVNSKEATFLDKGQAITVNVDGSDGVRLNPANGILFQLMDNDDPGPQPPNMWCTGVYQEPTTAPTADPGWNLTSTSGAAVANFSNITLNGNFYNSVGWTVFNSGMGPAGGEQNMALNFNKASITGVISSTEAHHYYNGTYYSSINSSQYQALGELTNTPSAAINNGVIVSLADGSNWTVTGTSYLTSLTIGTDSTVTAPAGYTVSMTVNGTTTPIVPGNNYTGAIVLTVTAN